MVIALKEHKSIHVRYCPAFLNFCQVPTTVLGWRKYLLPTGWSIWSFWCSFCDFSIFSMGYSKSLLFLRLKSIIPSYGYTCVNSSRKEIQNTILYFCCIFNFKNVYISIAVLLLCWSYHSLGMVSNAEHCISSTVICLSNSGLFFFSCYSFSFSLHFKYIPNYQKNKIILAILNYKYFFLFWHHF